MAVTVGKITGFMEEWAPVSLAEEWDNCGLLIGNSSYEVSRVLVALDAVSAVIEEAISEKCQMIVTHHPLFRAGSKKINDSDITGKKIMKLIENKIALYSAHTNLDKADGGVNDALCAKLGLSNVETMKDSNGNNALLRVAVLDTPQTLGSLAKKYEHVFNIPYLPIVGDLDREITKVAVVSGNGMSLMKEVVKCKADLFISGDVRYHDANDAIEAGIAMLDLTHYASEVLVTEPVKRYLEAKRDENGLAFEVLVSCVDAQPFRVISRVE